MKIDGIVMQDVQTIENNYDNIGILKICRYLLNVVINDIEYMNKDAEEIAGDYLIDYDLGNNTYIMKNDLESIVSITDTLKDIENYNEEEK